MRILMVHKEYYLGSGASRHVFALTKLLEKSGHEVVPFTMQDPKNKKSPYAKYFVSAADFSKVRYSPEAFFKNFGRMLWSHEAACKMRELLRHEKIDLAHIHNIYHQISPSILPVIRKQGIPIVQTMHDYKIMCPNYKMFARDKICEKCKYRRYWQPYFQKCVKDSRIASAVVGWETAYHKLIGAYEKNVDVFISPSKFLINKMREWRIKARRVEYLPNFVYPPENVPANTGQYILYGLARLSPEKGLWTFLKAAKNLTDIPFKVWGQGPLEMALKRYIKRNNITNVEMLGDPKTKEAINILINARAVVVPSEWYENNSYAIIEALSFRKPVIASDLGGNREMVGDRERGLLFRAGDTSALQGQIKKLWAAPALAHNLGSQGQEFVKEKLNANKYLENLLAIYESVKVNKAA